MKNSIAVIFFFLLAGGSFSQTKIDFAEVDKCTYKAWSEKRWHDLLDTCEMVINETKIDYFYLRMRAGVAAYELHKYRKAIIHFEKALEFSSGNKDALSLLIASKKFSGFTHDAEWTDTSAYGKPTVFSSVSVEYGNCTSPDYNDAKQSYNKPNSQRNLLQDMKLNGPFSYCSAFIVNNFSPKWQLNYELSFLTMEGYNQFRFDDNTVLPSVNRIYSNSFNVNQYGLYLAPVKYQKWNKQTTYFFHGFYINSDAVDYKIDGVVLPPQPPMGVLPSPVTFKINQDSSAFSAFEASFGISFRKNRIYYSREFSMAVFTSQVVKRFQLGYSLIWFPGAKSSFFSTTSLYGLAGNGLGYVAKQLFYVRAGRFFSIEPYIMYGDISYFSENAGAIVYNLPGIIRMKAGANLNIYLHKNCAINIGYAYSDCATEIKWLDYAGTTNMGKPRFNEINEELNYQNQLIYGGISWKF